jgi:rhamnose utilization protein RhaD (predicted bifunctional aldolase and dehydrogenase)
MNIRQLVTQYSVHIGSDPMLVQGAGGNVSWKKDGILWIKASGMWLAEAKRRDIFIPLNLIKVRQLIDANVCDFMSVCLTASSLRPSIETSLHALLPQRIVVHVHAVEVIARAVQRQASVHLTKCLAGLNWAWVDYAKPGLELTKKVASILHYNIPANHGLVVAGTSVEQVHSLLQTVLVRCKIKPRSEMPPDHDALDKLVAEWDGIGYQLPNDARYHTLGLDVICLELVRYKWALYPDHVIFLGSRAIFKDSKIPRRFFIEHLSSIPCVIVAGQGIVVNKSLNDGQYAMLNCYLNVILRLPYPKDVISLTDKQIRSLLDWDAEKYRQGLMQML